MAGRKKTDNSASKTRRAYPSYDERIAAADAKIARLEALIADRAALAKNQEALDKTIAKRAAIERRKENHASGVKVKLTPEQRAQKRREGQAKAREARKAQKLKYDMLVAALSDKGQTIDDIITSLQEGK